MPDEILRDREKALEEQFFAKENKKLLERMRERQQQQSSREGLARVSGIADATVLEKLVDLGIGPETWTALSVVPLVEVAWANGNVDKKERRAVMAGAEASGVTAGSPSHQLLQRWLERRPDGRLLQAWGEYIVGLCAQLDPGEKRALREEILGRARAVAEAAGGYLGLLNKVSREEERVLEHLAKAFER